MKTVFIKINPLSNLNTCLPVFQILNKERMNEEHATGNALRNASGDASRKASKNTSENASRNVPSGF